MATFSNLKPFVPSGDDFELARKFFRTLGFKENWVNESSGLVELQYGEDVVFLLQRFSNKEMQDNLMFSIEVDDLDGYWKFLQGSGALDMPGVRAKPPQDYPWGLREIHLIDPAGVFWHLVTRIS